MIKKPALTLRKRGSQSSTTASVPAPVGGWNARDSEATMPQKDALVLENWFPRATDVMLRKGAENFATDLPAEVQTLMPYASPTAEKLFAVSGTGIYDVSVAGAVGAAVSTVSSARMQYTAFNTLGGSYLLAVNGTDDLKLYDGTTWTDIDSGSTPAITGLATSSISHINIFKRRLWFVEKDSMSAWYMPVNQIGGAAVEFPLGQLFKRGGKLLAMATWTIDGGEGVDDHAVFLTSEGEIAVYKGTDPASVATWALVGIYYIGAPLGDRCFIKYGGDVLVLTHAGLFPLTKIFLAEGLTSKHSLADKISKAYLDAAALYENNIGWDCVAYNQEGMLLINVPVVNNGRSDQFVQNTVTGAWCKFTGWNAYSMVVWKGVLYFGTTQKVAKAWTGVGDFGNNITGKARPAFNYFGARGQSKHFKLIRPLIRVDGEINLDLGIDVDFEESTSYSTLAIGPQINDKWDSALWDSGKWGADFAIRREWRSVNAKEGYAAALRLRVATNAVRVAWSATDFVYQKGGVL